MKNSRRLKRVTVSGIAILDWLVHPNKSGIEVVEGPPEDVKFEYFGHSECDNEIFLVLSSETWEEMPEFGPIPEFWLVYRKAE